MEKRLRLAKRRQAAVISAVSGAQGERLLELAEFVGNLAWWCHSGSFACREVELALRAGAGLQAASGRLATGPVRGRTLHVLTTALLTGGHTRLAQRWMELMSNEPAAVLVTRQGVPLDPTSLCPPGREVALIDLEREGVRTRLAKLGETRRLMEAAARVVLHIHPDDAVTVAAAHQVSGVPITFVNHADHVAWLGAALPVPLLQLRSAGGGLATRRRGVLPGRNAYVPLPLTEPPHLDRREARQSLGFGDGDVVMLTVAADYKYRPTGGRSLLEPLTKVLAHPRLRLVAIGPDARHEVFGALAERFPGKVSALGIVPRPHAHRVAADIYLDSFPFCSTTSLLENAQLGTAAVAYQPDASELDLFYSDWESLPRGWFGCDSAEALTERILALAEQPTLREASGARLREGTRLHLPGPWQESLAACQRRVFPQDAWMGCAAPREDALDQILAGLGKEPAEYPAWKRWPAGFRLRALWERGVNYIRP